MSDSDIKDQGKATIREVYDLHETTRKEMKDGFDKIDQKIDALAVTFALKQDVKNIGDDMHVIKSRIKTLERWKWYTTGAVVVIVFLINLFIADIKELFLGR